MLLIHRRPQTNQRCLIEQIPISPLVTLSSSHLMKFLSKISNLIHLTLLALLLQGCDHKTKYVVSQESVKQMGETLKEIQDGVDKVQNEQKALQQNYENLKTANTEEKQFVTDQVYKAGFANEKNVQQNEYTDLTGKHLEKASANLLTPSDKAKLDIVEDLRLALSQSEEDKKKLQRRLDELDAESEVLKKKKEELEADIEAQKEELGKTTQNLVASVSDFEKQKTVAEVALANQREAENQEKRQMRAKNNARISAFFMLGGGIVSALAVGAFMLRVPGVLGAGLGGGAVMFLIGWAIGYIEDIRDTYAPWFDIIVILISVVTLGILVSSVIRSLKTRGKAQMDEKISDTTVAAIQEFRNDDSLREADNFSLLEPYLKRWHMDEEGDPDTKIRKEIRNRVNAMHLNRSRGSTPGSDHPVPPVN